MVVVVVVFFLVVLRVVVVVTYVGGAVSLPVFFSSDELVTKRVFAKSRVIIVTTSTVDIIAITPLIYTG